MNEKIVEMVKDLEGIDENTIDTTNANSVVVTQYLI